MLAFGKFKSIIITALGFAFVFLIFALIMVINAIFDVETDKVNAPHWLIPSGLVSQD